MFPFPVTIIRKIYFCFQSVKDKLHLFQERKEKITILEKLYIVVGLGRAITGYLVLCLVRYSNNIGLIMTADIYQSSQDNT